MNSLCVSVCVLVVAYLQVIPISTVPNGNCPHGHKSNFTLQNPVKPLWNKIKQFKVAVLTFIQNKLTMLQNRLGGGGGLPALSVVRPPGTNTTKDLPQARATVLLVHHTSCSCGQKNCTCGNANCTGACC